MEFTTLNIGDAAEASGVSAKMIRHYEEIGLIPKPKRTFSGYRTYAETDVHTLRFVRHARKLGFSIQQIEQLLGLWQDRRRPSAKVKRLVLEHIQELEKRIRELYAMKATLESLAAHCHGNERPDCPILDGLAMHTHADACHVDATPSKTKSVSTKRSPSAKVAATSRVDPRQKRHSAVTAVSKGRGAAL